MIDKKLRVLSGICETLTVSTLGLLFAFIALPPIARRCQLAFPSMHATTRRVRCMVWVEAFNTFAEPCFQFLQSSKNRKRLFLPRVGMPRYGSLR